MRSSPGILVVSNRAPISFSGRASRLRLGRGAGGVVTALGQLRGTLPLTWVAPTTTESDRDVSLSLRERGGRIGRGKLRLRFVDLPTELVTDHNERFSNQILWFIQHGLWSRRLAPEDPATIGRLYDRYLAAGAAVAEAVATEVHRPGQASDVFTQDYQLYGVPAAVRRLTPGLGISLFVHIPWPKLGTWREALPDAITGDIIRRMLDADAVGFQDWRSRDHFVEAAARLVAAEPQHDRVRLKSGRIVICRVRPASVNPEELSPDRSRLEALRPRGVLRIVRVDRVDPIKNVPTGFIAFERLLEAHPEWVGRVQFLARLLPTRMSVPEYAAEWEATARAIERVRRRFGDSSIEVCQTPDRGQALAELASADVTLVNSLADGMNLVAKEAAVLNREGVLVLSRRAGASAELQEGALEIDPESVDATVNALQQALTMPLGERRLRAGAMRRAVHRWTGRDWFAALRADLDEARAERRAPARARDGVVPGSVGLGAQRLTTDLGPTM